MSIFSNKNENATYNQLVYGRMSHPKVLSTLDKLATDHGIKKRTYVKKNTLKGLALGALISLAFFSGLLTDRLVLNKSLSVENLENLTVVVSEEIGTVPARLWLGMERNAGKKASAMSPSEKIEAVNYLIQSLKKQPELDGMSVW